MIGTSLKSMRSDAPTIQDVARVAGVSTATVSRALSTPDRVSDRTRSIVLEAVESTGYVANEMARNLRQQKSNSICVIAPDLSNPFFSFIISGIEQICGPRGYGVFVTESGLSQKEKMRVVNLMAASRTDGYIVLDGMLDHSMLKARGRPGNLAPIVSACEWTNSSAAPSVTVDNVGGAMQAVQHFAALGHTKVGHITGPKENVLTVERIKGFKQGLDSCGLEYRDDFVLEGGFSLESGQTAAETWLKMKDRPTAMFCASDREAFGFISRLAKDGVRVPEDVSVIGFDDIEVSGYFVPALTTVSQPRVQIGRRAAEMLFELIQGEADPKDAHPQLDVALVVRDSTAAPSLLV